MSDKSKLAEMLAERNLSFASGRNEMLVEAEDGSKVKLCFDKDGRLVRIYGQKQATLSNVSGA